MEWMNARTSVPGQLQILAICRSSYGHAEGEGVADLWETLNFFRAMKSDHNPRPSDTEVPHMALKVLFIGGTGQISYPCVERAVRQGHHVSVYNRGLRNDPLPAGVTSIVGELGSAAYADLAKANYDVVCQFIAFTPDQIARDIDIFPGPCCQY